MKIPQRLIKLSAKATAYKDVQISWYPQKGGWNHPQFETENGGIAQDESDYYFYCAAANFVRKLLAEEVK